MGFDAQPLARVGTDGYLAAIMDQSKRTRISKFLSYALRHRPDAFGIELEPGGWIDVETLLRAAAGRGKRIRIDELQTVVGECPKQRFTLDGGRIRANQGHSVDIELELNPTPPPAVLYHGTHHRAVDAILVEGLRKMARHHVHLSADVATARAVGARRGRPVVLRIDAAAMAAGGHDFFVSTNGVWLVDDVPPQFLRRD